MDGSEMTRFLLDGMLGRLARWLRILGYDAQYAAHWDDNELARVARAEDRILLTRDIALSRRRGLNALLIEHEDVELQLLQVMRTFDLSPGEAFSRCPVCNTPLELVAKDMAWGMVPPYIFKKHDTFRLCPVCNQFYWQGTHWQRMRQKLGELLASEAKDHASTTS